MQFNQVIGQSLIKEKLISMVTENRVSHALLFAGPEGCGHLPMALAFIQYLNCVNKINDESCGKCNNCIKFQKLIHPDLHLVFPINSTDKIKGDKLVTSQFIQDFRSAVLDNPYLNLFDWLQYIGIENKQGIISERESDELIKKLSLRAYESEYKCAIIWMAERMHDACANKLLKLLEEPPHKTIFILIAQQPEQLLPTILSRTQTVKFGPINYQDIYQWIVTTQNISDPKASEIAHQSEGNFNKVLTLVQSIEENDYLTQFSTWMRLCYLKKFEEVLDWINQITKGVREEQKKFLEYALTMVRECLIRHGGATDISYLGEKEKEFIEKFYPFINLRNIHQIMNEFNQAIYHIERNGNGKIIFLDVTLKLFGLLRQ
jgi:DNA polymerase-3 subunit delta'